MTSNDDHQDFPYYRSPSSIRDETFTRRMRGLDADEVYEYLDLLADQVQAAELERREYRAENQRLQAELERVRGELAEFEQQGDRVNEQVVKMFAKAQLVAEEMVDDVSRDARERLGQARAHERQIVEQAVNAAGDQVRSYAEAAQAQMQSIMSSFASQVEQLGDASRVTGSSAPSYDENGWPVLTPRRADQDHEGSA
jgi:DivIVA domain-containing protein